MSGSVVELTQKVADLTARVAELEQENSALHQLIAAYKQAIYGQSSERVDPKQADLDLGDLDATAPLPTPANDEDGAHGDDTPKAPRRGGQARRNRGALPRHLPRKHVHLEPDTNTCPCCAGALHKIGEDIREQLDVVPALYRVLCIHRARYGCRACRSAVVQAPAPEQPVDGGYATCTLIAQIAVGKWAWHLPLYRQAKMLAGQGIVIDRSTLANWMARAAWWLRPLHDCLREAVLARERVFCDDTPLPVLAPGKGRTQTGRFWAYAVDDRSWSGPAPPAVAYLYAEDRKARHMTGHLRAFSGILQVDGYQGYGQLADRDGLPITLAYCLAHARRKFHKVHLTIGSPIAAEALRRIAEIYAIEARVRGKTAAERLAVRQAQSAPRMGELKAWLMARLGEISQQSALAKAIRYTLGHWDGLCAFLTDGRIEVDSNTVEQQMRPVALGRRNSLFAGSEGGAETWAILASLIQTAKLNDLDPLTYLADVLQRIVDGSVPVNRLDALLPWNWTADAVAQAA